MENNELELFTKYCQENPGERFWQALRNWSGQDFIYFGNMTNRHGSQDKVSIEGVRVYLTDSWNHKTTTDETAAN